MLQKLFFLPVVEGNIASEKEYLIPLTSHRVYTHFLILGSKKVFCCLQNHLSSSVLSGIDVSFFLSLVAMFFAAKLLSSRCSFIMRSAVHFNTYAMLSLLRVFVYFYSRSLFLSPYLPGRKFEALQCCTQLSALVVSHINSPAASFTQDVFYLQ